MSSLRFFLFGCRRSVGEWGEMGKRSQNRLGIDRRRDVCRCPRSLVHQRNEKFEIRTSRKEKRVRGGRKRLDPPTDDNTHAALR